MQNQLFHRDRADGAALSACKLSPVIQSTQLKEHRTIRIALPAVPRHHACPLDKYLRQQQRRAELSFWEATGGDCLNSAIAGSLARLSPTRRN